MSAQAAQAILHYRPLKVFELHVTYRPGKTMIRPAHAYTHSVSLSHRLAMESAEDYMTEVRDCNISVYGRDRDTFHRDTATEVPAGWTLGYWSTLKSGVHITFKISEMFMFPTELFVLDSLSSVDAESNDSS